MVRGRQHVFVGDAQAAGPEGLHNTVPGHDLLARRYVPCAYLHPFAEAVAGTLMVVGSLLWLAAGSLRCSGNDSSAERPVAAEHAARTER